MSEGEFRKAQLGRFDFMKVQFRIRGYKDNAELRRRLQQPLKRLANEISISTAAVVIERELNSAPAFRAVALLAVPGPDIHTEARDHTAEAAWLKVTSALGKQIKLRKARQNSEMKRNGQVRNHANGRVRRTGGRQ